MSLQRWYRGFVLVVLLIGGWAASRAPVAWGQEELHRKSKVQVAAVYPALARQMHVTGTVKILVTVSPNGSVKNAKVVGGHPLLVEAAMDAVKQWRFETSPDESTGIVEFHFDPIK
ncbi:MAG: energy transducer TonB [Terriglobales bacterium]